MKPDILLPRSYLKKFHLVAFQTLILNLKFPAVIGISSAESVEVSEDFIERCDLPLYTPLHLSSPASIIPVKHVVVLVREIIGVLASSHLALQTCLSPYIQPSLLYRLQRRHIVLGSVERIRVLGFSLCIQYVEASSTSGETICMEKKSETHGYNDCKSDSWICSFVPTPSQLSLFKINALTKLTITWAAAQDLRSVGELETSVPQAFKNCSSNAVPDVLFSLDAIEEAINNYLRDFALNSLHVTMTAHSPELESGIILYGLPGCGKRSLLQKISSKVPTDIKNKVSILFG